MESQGAQRAHAAYFGSIDIAKFVLSIMIVLLHISPFGEASVYVRPILRAAVPLFFLISAFFYFGKQARTSSVEDRVENLIHYVKRNLQLYAFWLVVLFVPTLKYRSWFDDGFLNGLFYLAHSFFFSSTFIVSWFIMACIWAAVILTVLNRFMSNGVVLALCVFPYLACCILSNYYGAPGFSEHVDALSYAFGDGAYNTFWAALLWMQLGKVIAERKEHVSRLPLAGFVAVLACGLVCLAFEQAYVVAGGYAVADDCYFALPLVCVPAFLLVLRAKVPFRVPPFFRAASTVTYCLHDTLNVSLLYLGASFSPLAMDVIVLCVSWALTAAVLCLERCDCLGWLRFAH